MQPFVYDWKNDFATHQPVLYAAALATGGPMAEFGCGFGSTPLLHRIATAQRRRLVTLDNDESWLQRFRAELETPLHVFRLVTDWDAELRRDEWDGEWSLVFVDQSPWEARAATIRRFAPTAELVVVHDADHLPQVGLLGRELEPLAGPRHRGRRDYSDAFSSWRELFPPEPWPYPPTGPPTLLGSNRRDVGTVEIDYGRHLPRAWRVRRELRRTELAARQLRTRATRRRRERR